MEHQEHRYLANETMRLIGNQCSGIVSANIDQIMDILRAHKRTRLGDCVAASDVFILGYIEGIRAERARKHKAQGVEQ